MNDGRAVRAIGLGHGFPGTPLLFESLDFEARPGDVVGLCGPSGSGKSTLLSIFAGWETPSMGRVERVRITRTGWVFQNPHGVAHRKAIDHVVFPFLAAGSTRGEAVELARPILASFKLTAVADRSFRELSGGEAQRLMLARAVATRPSLLLVDEPTAQLDLRTSETVNQTLGAVAQEGAIVLIATHDPGTRDACNCVIQLEDYAPTRGVAA
ncbi:ABC transporter [Microbacterium arborescens]|uniref:ABC transporter n=1 Tax=Microbacterium arborescens TaxID=33883 RepID=A0ABX2WF53_9MICO|nr:ATP-binding cassette domain-containing protein [Microbacterium arborescens]OAZ39000.1 ABC transporter [Microbacterium arborescens]